MSQYCGGCNNMMMLRDNGGAEGAFYQCLSCGAKTEMGGENTLLFVQTLVDEVGSNTNFSTLIKSMSGDVTNMRVDKPCEQCHMQYMTFCLAGQEESPYLSCTCSAIYKIDRSQIFNVVNSAAKQS